ncbi:hypothetical protein C5E06_10115 [Pseudoclavibacter sp. RFBI5]|nr:hypothetical protein C5E06_10115 [Pseudoclavibacter sp. RFBI5]
MVIFANFRMRRWPYASLVTKHVPPTVVNLGKAFAATVGFIGSVYAIVEGWGTETLSITLVVSGVVGLIITSTILVKPAWQAFKRYRFRLRAALHRRRFHRREHLLRGAVTDWSALARISESGECHYWVMHFSWATGDPEVHRIVAYQRGQVQWEAHSAESRVLGSAFEPLNIPDRLMITWRDANGWNCTFIDGAVPAQKAAMALPLAERRPIELV